ncbi:MAG: hypothetical protein CMF43_00620 [Legionellales bacterium]|nr:hypothetical protein [Legionellales bacterium]|tara:strand:+ start:952 stop:1623 length:672 start_codon:yes stop_codon:yes gene_type:complete
MLNSQTSTSDQPRARARRLLALRGLAGLSRDLLHKRYGIAKATVQNWESARAGGLTRKGAQRILKVYHAEGVVCSFDWLMHGVGVGPELVSQLRSVPASDVPTKASLSGLAGDIDFLRTLYDHVVDMPLDDRSMQPAYPQSAHLVGISYYKDHIQQAVGHDCIIHAVSHPPMFRRLMPSDQVDHYHLVPLNLSGDFPIITNVEVLSAAPVLWVRSEAFTYQAG